MNARYWVVPLIFLSLCGCVFWENDGGTGASDAAVDGASDGDSDSDTDTDSDSDADADQPGDKWMYVFPLVDSIQVATDLPLALDPADGSELWSAGSYHSRVPAMTALADGTLLAATNIGYHRYNGQGETTWYVDSDGNWPCVVGSGGAIVAAGQYQNNISNAVFAYQWTVGHGTGWYRGNADNANTRWAAP